jgi:hypothetical protein
LPAEEQGLNRKAAADLQPIALGTKEPRLKRLAEERLIVLSSGSSFAADPPTLPSRSPAAGEGLFIQQLASRSVTLIRHPAF